MDPYLEHPSLWPDVHNRLITAVADDLSERVAPRYYVGLERRTYLLKADDVVFIGRPDIAMVSTTGASIGASLPATTSVTVLEVEVPMQDEVSENFLEIHEVKTGKLITILELLSPVNKLHNRGGRSTSASVDTSFAVGPTSSRLICCGLETRCLWWVHRYRVTTGSL